jgi:tripartite motif-containing protein 71
MSNILLYSFGKKGEFFYPKGITCDNSGNIIVSDSGKNCIQVFTSKGEFLFSFGRPGEEEGQFVEPSGVTCDKDGNIVICDAYNHRIQVFNSKREFLFSFGSQGEEEGQFIEPLGVTCNKDGNIIVCDSLNSRIQVFKLVTPIDLESKFNSKGKFLFSFGSLGSGEGQFCYPEGLACDQNGNIVVCDTGNHRIQVFTSKGEFLFSFGIFGEEEGKFDEPTGVTFDHEGNYVVCDTNNRIQVFNKEGKFLHSFESRKCLEPTRLTCDRESYVIEPVGLTCDLNGNIFVCDPNNSCIQVFKGPSEVPSLLSLCWEKIDTCLQVDFSLQK